MADHRVLMRFGRYMARYWKTEMVVLVLLVVGTVTSLAPPYLMKVIIDDVFPFGDKELLVVVLAALLAAVLTGALAMFGVDYLYNWIANRVMRDIREDFFAHLLRLPQGFFQAQKAGDLIFRINNDVNQIQFILSASLLRLLHGVLVLVGIAAMLWWLNAWLFAVAMVTVPLFVLNVQYFQSRIRRVTEAGQKQHARIMDFFKERFENVKLIQLSNAYGHEQKALEGHLERLVGLNMEGAVYSASLRGIGTGLVSVSPLLVFGWGGYQVMAGTMTLGAVIAFLNYLLRIYEPIQSLNGLYVDLVRAGVSMRRVLEFMAVPDERARQEGPLLPLGQAGTVAFESLSFAFDGTEVLRGMQLEFERGKSYGVCGPSGCGKSTLVNLLLRFHSPDAGRIRVGAADLQHVDVDEVRSWIALVPQETLLFHDTVEANIRYGSWEAPPDRIAACAALTGLDEQLRGLGLGEASVIGDRGAQLSGGQKQRVAITRALLREAQILVLDEATSALDADSERMILRAVARRYADRTLVVISHRPQVLQELDEVIYLDRGRVLERGGHTELMARRGGYWRMVQGAPPAAAVRA